RSGRSSPTWPAGRPLNAPAVSSLAAAAALCYLRQRYPKAVPAGEVGVMWRSLSLIVVSLTLGTIAALAGCNRSADGSFVEAGAFGRFEGEVVASWADNGRDMVLREPFLYIDSANRQWVAPAGSVVNGASIP